MTQLFRAWIDVLPASSLQIASRIIGEIAALAIEFESEFFANVDVGRASLDALVSTANRRPEFRFALAPSIVQIIQKQLSSSQLVISAPAAFDLALAYLDAMPEEVTREILTMVLDFLQRIGVNRKAWMIVRPALQILVSAPAQELIRSDAILGRQLASAVFLFGMEQESEHWSLLIYLDELSGYISEEELNSDRLREIVDALIKGLNINSSAATRDMLALLSAPRIVGREGVLHVLERLGAILDSSVGRRPAISFASAYDVLIFLSNRLEGIQSGSAIEPLVLSEILQGLLGRVVLVWEQAVKNPMIFAPFSLPPATTPNFVLIHNWAFASIGFARAVGDEEKIRSALGLASMVPLMHESIALANSSRIVAGDPDPFDESAIGNEEARPFYAALGMRLLLAKSESSVRKEAIAKALLSKCLALGPNGLDSAVLLLAAELGVRFDQQDHAVSDYKKRLGNDRDLRSALGPLVRELCQVWD